MAKIDVSYTPEEIRAFSERDMVLASLFSALEDPPFIHDSKSDNYTRYSFSSSMSSGLYQTRTSVTLGRYSQNTGRKIGLILGTLDDGSFNIAILGNNNTLNNTHGLYTRIDNNTAVHAEVVSAVSPEERVLSPQNQQTVWRYSDRWDEDCNNIHVEINNFSPLSEVDSVEYQPAWQPTTGSDLQATKSFLFTFGKLNGVDLSQDINANYNRTSFPLTTSPNTTLVIGDQYHQYQYCPAKDFGYDNGFRNIGGAINAIGHERGMFLTSAASGTRIYGDPSNWHGYMSEMTTGSYAAHYIPFNLILTRNESEALTYLDTGALPSDAFIYPYDVDHIPTNTSGEDPDSGGGDDASTDTPGEDGDPSDTVDDMPTTAPTYGPMSMTNNNLYWLSALDLKNFIHWFWTDATDVASLGDLWDKITGLYENLSESILNIKYMPVEPSWIGSTGTDTKIIVGMLEYPYNCATINKSMAPVRQIGEYSIETMFNGSFANYTPYSSIMLYLPFHGMVELDNDLIMSKKICVSAMYDILAGTIQYFIHRDSYSGPLVYTTVARMSVDIPITLQTKTDRDSAIIQNIGSVTAGLIGAGASAVAGSPIGLTMGLANMSNFQPTSAGWAVKGNVSESGAFYAPTKCAIYIKRPAYNRPTVYKSRVGFPANVERTLSQCEGFTTCYKPRISFSNNTYTDPQTQDTITIKPTKEEVDTIYAYLEKGVII